MSTVVFIANLIFQRSPWKLVSQNDTLKMVFLILWWQLVFCTKKVVPWINCSWKRYGSYCPCSSLFRTIAWLCSFFNPFKLREILIMFLVPGWHIFNWSPISCFFFTLQLLSNVFFSSVLVYYLWSLVWHFLPFFIDILFSWFPRRSVFVVKTCSSRAPGTHPLPKDLWVMCQAPIRLRRLSSRRGQWPNVSM